MSIHHNVSEKAPGPMPREQQPELYPSS